MKTFDRWREKEIKRVGLATQLRAEALLDKHESEPRVEVNNDKSGERAIYKRDVADRLTARGECSKRKTYYFMPGAR